MQGLLVLALVFAVATAIVLIIGVAVMAKGGKFNKKYSNKLMQMRVAAQALTILLFAILAFAAAG